MAVLETIRVKIGWLITILIALALLSFIVDFNSLASVINTSSDKYSVGEIGGKKVPYKDFQEQVEYQTTISEIVNGSSTSSDEQLQQIRNAAWQHFVDQNLFLKQAHKAGIEVGVDELADLTVGDMVSPVIAYDRAFGNAAGKADVEAIKNFVKNLDNDASGNSRLYWEYLQNTVLIQQYYTKYQSLFSASAVSNALTVANAMEENNTSAKISSVLVPYDYKHDSTIVVSSSEIKKYYSDHKKDFKQLANRDVKYAVFEVVPSEADKDAAFKSISDVYDEFASSENLKNFLMRNSNLQLRNYWYRPGELNVVNREVNDFVFGNAKGTSPVYKDGDNYYAVRVVAAQAVPDSVYVRHILVQGNNSLVDSLFNVVSKDRSQFPALAAKFSADQNPNAVVPGEIGWMTQTYMIPGMEDVMTAKAGKPFVIDTRYGRHIVEVVKTSKPVAKKKVAILQKTAVPSKATMNRFFAKANSLATKAGGKLEGLIAAAKEDTVYLQDMNVYESTARYGAADRAKEVTRWIFDAKKGEASNVITVNQNFLCVVAVKEIHKEGYKSVSEVKNMIENLLYNKKAQDKKLAEVNEKVAACTTIDEAAKALGVQVINKEDVTFASFLSRDNEPALLGAVAGVEQGKLSKAVKGESGIILVQVNDRAVDSHYTDEDARNMENQKVSYTSRMIVPSMLEATGSVDHRERFY